MTLYKWGNSVVEKIEKERDEIKAIHTKLTPEDPRMSKITGHFQAHLMKKIRRK